MNYALIEKGMVVNLICLSERNAAEFPNAVNIDGRPVAIGDSYTEGVFYRDGKKVLSKEETLADAQAALALLIGAQSDYTAKAVTLRPVIEFAAQSLDDGAALEVPALFPAWDAAGEYAAGVRVRYEDKLYRCLQAHTAQESWTPEVVSSLWAKVLIPDPEVIPDWEQPESTNPYMKGDKVRHNDKTWQSTIDNNVWEPGVYGWKEYI